MTSRILSFLAGAALVATLAYTVPAAWAQTNPGAPGACPNGVACQNSGQMVGRMGSGEPMRQHNGANMPANRMGGQAQGMSGGLIGAAADKLDMTNQAVLAELQSGKTIADLADSKGIDVNTIIDAFVAPQSARLDALVASGAVTQQQAADAKASMRTHITVLVNSPMDSWVTQAHEPLMGARPANAGQGQPGQPGMMRGTRWNNQ